MNRTTSTIAPHEEQLSVAAKTYSAKAYAAESASSDLTATSIQRRAPQPQDVEIEILYCGVCHSDLHAVRDEWHAFMPTVQEQNDGVERHVCAEEGRRGKHGNQESWLATFCEGTIRLVHRRCANRSAFSGA